MIEKNQINYLDLFSGIGGFRLGLKQAGFKFNNCFHSEIDKYANQIYEQHFPNSKQLGDVKTINTNELPRINLITFGFPCQDLSIAGKREGLGGARSNLFFEAVRLIKELKPDIFIFENVKGLLSSNEGKDFEIVLRTIADIGLYECEWQLLNTKWFLPQNRERVYFIGHLTGGSSRKVFPIREVNKVSNGTQREAQRNGKWVRSISNRYYKDGSEALIQVGNIDTKNHNSIWGRVYDTEGISSTLNGEGGGLGAKTGLYKVHNMLPRSGNPKQGGTGHLTKEDGTTYNLDTGNTNAIENESGIRRLTPIECERLQGFPEIKKYVIIEICKDNQKNYVNVETPNLKLPLCVGNAEKIEKLASVQFAGKVINIKFPQKNKPVQPDVLIFCEENRVEIHNQKRLLLNAKGVEKKNWSHPLIKIDDFVQLLVGISTIKEKITNFGEVELRQKEECLTHQKSGQKQEKLYGNEITQSVGDVKNNLITLNELLRSITLNPSDTKNSEQKLITLCSFVIHVISGYIPKETLNQDTFTIGINTKVGHTYGISDTQRYKTLGNAVTTNVVKAIGEKLY